MSKHWSIVFLAVAMLAACGGSQSPAMPSPQYGRGNSTSSGPAIAAQSGFCTQFHNAKAGAVSASAIPPTLRVTIAVGACGNGGQVLGEKDGEVSNWKPHWAPSA